MYYIKVYMTISKNVPWGVYTRCAELSYLKQKDNRDLASLLKIYSFLFLLSNIYRSSQESAVSDIIPRVTDAAIDLNRAVIW